MLEMYQDLWKSGRLGEISATVELEPGTKPIRSMPNGRLQSSSFRRKMVPYASVSTTAA